MSALDRPALSPLAPGVLPHSRLRRIRETERPAVRVGTFFALALYGVLRWTTLTQPAPGLRLLGLLALATALVAAPVLPRRKLPPLLADRLHNGWYRAALRLAAAIVMLAVLLALCGIPATWIVDLRIALAVQGIQQGLSSLPGVLVPYLGLNQWVRIVILLGAGLLLLSAAVTVCTRSPSELRRAAAALQLAALAIVPAIVMRPLVPYVQGLLLFVLVAAFLWGERIVSVRSGTAVAVVGIAALLAVAIAPALARHQPWVNYESLTGALASKHIERFDWSQRYGPYEWPRTDRSVLAVKARHADYWKTENLDVFDGFGWREGVGPVSAAPPPIAPAALRRWSQTITVTLEGIKTTDVVAAGFAVRPAHIDAIVAPGKSTGTWTADSPLGPGETYTVRTYSPRPSAAQLSAIPASTYPDAALADYRVVGLPVAAQSQPEVEFPPFHSGGPLLNLAVPFGAVGRRLVVNSPYARAYALASRLAAGAATPYDFVVAVERYLSPSNGFKYDEQVSASTFPLESFLFSNRRGYCQQFAGAMALLLRMGGLPARVATGFASGLYNPATRQYVVADRDAHAWVEVWFPHYGWVRFDPTPAIAPAISGSNIPPALRAPVAKRRPVTARRGAVTGGGGLRNAARGKGGFDPLLVVLPLAAVLVVLIAGRLAQRRRPPTAEQLIAELELALARCGRPARDGLTLQGLERRFRQSPAAARYLRRLRVARYGLVSEPPTGLERRALRGQLATGLGMSGRLRAWWALPPRPLGSAERTIRPRPLRGRR